MAGYGDSIVGISRRIGASEAKGPPNRVNGCRELRIDRHIFGLFSSPRQNGDTVILRMQRGIIVPLREVVSRSACLGFAPHSLGRVKHRTSS
jgi:hypothetical protein